MAKSQSPDVSPDTWVILRGRVARGLGARGPSARAERAHCEALARQYVARFPPGPARQKAERLLKPLSDLVRGEKPQTIGGLIAFLEGLPPDTPLDEVAGAMAFAKGLWTAPPAGVPSTYRRPTRPIDWADGRGNLGAPQAPVTKLPAAGRPQTETKLSLDQLGL